MNTPVKSVKPETPIKEAVEEMMVDGISQMPVIDGEEVVGSITESSIVRAVMEKGSGAEMLQVKDVMEDPFPMIDPNESLNTVSKLLTESQAVLVVENGKVVGIITKHDLMKFLKIPR
jgi:predicted transcriptional regulator